MSLFGGKKEEEIKKEKVSTSFNFDNDIRFLHHLIDSEVLRTLKSLELRIDKRDPLLTDHVKERATQTSFNVMSVLSDVYLGLLSNYFNEDGLSIYIINRVTDTILDYAHKHNYNILISNRIEHNLEMIEEFNEGV